MSGVRHSFTAVIITKFFYDSCILIPVFEVNGHVNIMRFYTTTISVNLL